MKIPIFRGGNWGTERLSNLPLITQFVSGWDRSPNRAILLPDPPDTPSSHVQTTVYVKIQITAGSRSQDALGRLSRKWELMVVQCLWTLQVLIHLSIYLSTWHLLSIYYTQDITVMSSEDTDIKKKNNTIHTQEEPTLLWERQIWDTHTHTHTHIDKALSDVPWVWKSTVERVT